MRPLKLLINSFSELLASGIYGLLLSALGFIFFPLLWLPAFALGGNTDSGDAVITALVLLLGLTPIAGVIWGWTMALLREKVDICGGIFLSVATPGLLFVYWKSASSIIDDFESSPNIAMPATLLMFLGGWIFFCLMTFAWVRFSWGRPLQNFIRCTTLDECSRGVRLLIVALLSQILVLGVYFYGRLTN